MSKTIDDFIAVMPKEGTGALIDVYDVGMTDELKADFAKDKDIMIISLKESIRLVKQSSQPYEYVLLDSEKEIKELLESNGISVD